MLNKPDTVLPRADHARYQHAFAFFRPELPMAPDEELKKPNLVGTGVQAGRAMAPLLKNPDDGALVESQLAGAPENQGLVVAAPARSRCLRRR